MIKFLVILAVAIGIFIANPVVANPQAQWKREQIAQLVPVQGKTYRNDEYGFSVSIPAGIQAYQSVPPAPNHGIRLLLGHRRAIEVSAVFDAPEYGSTKVQLDHSIKSEQADDVTRTPAALAGQVAEKAVLKKGPAVVVIVGQRRDDGKILYELTLTTTRAALAKDTAVFNQLLSGFQEHERAQ